MRSRGLKDKDESGAGPKQDHDGYYPEQVSRVPVGVATN
jgi:hypothetical protein